MPPTTTTTSTFSFFLWPETAQNSAWDNGLQPVRASDRLRAKRQARDDKWEAENVRRVGPPRLRPPSQQDSLERTREGKPSQAANSGQNLAESPAAFSLDPYGYALTFWATGAVVWFRHPHLLMWWCCFAGVVVLLTPPNAHKYLIRTAFLIGVSYWIFHKYLLA